MNKNSNNNKYYLTVAVMALMISTLAVSGIVNAAEDTTQTESVEQSKGNFATNYNNEEAQQAIENNDYQAWRQAVADNSTLLDLINEDNWDKFVEMHTDLANARQIAEELGLPAMRNQGRDKGPKGFMNEEARTALDNADYQAWLEAVGADSVLAQTITSENFNLYVQAHQLMQNGDSDAAKQIFDELGLQRSQAKNQGNRNSQNS